MRVHITGASGFLGRALVRQRRDATTDRVDVRDEAALATAFERHRPDVVIHARIPAGRSRSLGRHGGRHRKRGAGVGRSDVSRAELAERITGRPVRRGPSPPDRPHECRRETSRARELLVTRLRGVRARYERVAS